MPSTNSNAVKVLFKPSSNNDETEIIAVTVVVQTRNAELAIERARELFKLGKTEWTVQRVVENPILPR